MVHVEFWRPGGEIGRSERVATLTQRGREAPKIEGREPEVFDLDRRVPNTNASRTICWDDDPEEWARSLVGSYRSPYLAAEIVHDDHPTPEPAGKRLVVHQRMQG
jgi:hypothetical protein